MLLHIKNNYFIQIFACFQVRQKASVYHKYSRYDQHFLRVKQQIVEQLEMNFKCFLDLLDETIKSRTKSKD